MQNAQNTDLKLITGTRVIASAFKSTLADMNRLRTELQQITRLGHSMKPGRDNLRLPGWALREDLTKRSLPVPSINEYHGLNATSPVVCVLPDELEETMMLSSVRMEGRPSDSGGPGASTQQGEILAALVKAASLMEFFCKNASSESLLSTGTIASSEALVTKRATKLDYSISLALFQHICGVNLRRGQGTEPMRIVAGLFVGSVAGYAAVLMDALLSNALELQDNDPCQKTRPQKRERETEASENCGKFC